jgi:hypothetical protein
MLVRLFGVRWRYAAPCDSETHMLVVGQYDDWRYFVPARPTFYARTIKIVFWTQPITTTKDSIKYSYETGKLHSSNFHSLGTGSLCSAWKRSTNLSMFDVCCAARPRVRPAKRRRVEMNAVVPLKTPNKLAIHTKHSTYNGKRILRILGIYVLFFSHDRRKHDSFSPKYLNYHWSWVIFRQKSTRGSYRIWFLKMTQA